VDSAWITATPALGPAFRSLAPGGAGLAWAQILRIVGGDGGGECPRLRSGIV
jgi:hypothetical protein